MEPQLLPHVAMEHTAPPEPVGINDGVVIDDSDHRRMAPHRFESNRIDRIDQIQSNPTNPIVLLLCSTGAAVFRSIVARQVDGAVWRCNRFVRSFLVYSSPVELP